MTIGLLLFSAITFGQQKGFSIKLTVTERDTKEAVVMGNISLQPSGALAVTDMDGKAEIKNVPEGEYLLQISYVGYESVRQRIQVKRDLQLRYQLTPTSLALREVQVTAKHRENGASTSSVIGRQAIDHLQATSLADVMQLIPGQLMGNQDLTAQSNLQLRTLVNNNTSAFGSSIVVDGMPMSNNGSMSEGQFSAAAFTGTDLRQISADNIEEVEVVRGIPSAEYGDLTSGLVVVRSKVGVTPWQAKGKITPELRNVSLGKGFNMGQAGVFNANIDYAQAWGDPRQKTRSYHRYTANLGWGKDFSKKWHTDTKLRVMQAKDWTGKDPDAIQDGTENKATTTTVGLTHNGKLQMDLPLMRALKYTVGLSYSKLDTRNSSFVATSTGLLPIITAMETGYYDTPWMTTSYLATGITESRPGNVYAKVGDDFFLRKGKTVQSFKLGADYHYDWNSGKGYYNDNPERPYRSNSNGRPRAFNDVPGLHQIALFAEDQLTYNINKVQRLRVGLGLRLTSLQPFSDVSTTALSPRLNVALTAAKWLDLRAGIGMNSKTPGLSYLYPDKKYEDRVAANYMPQDGSQQVLVYHTQVYDVKRSTDLKNATTTKIELGFDVKLPGSRRFSVLAYRDKTPNGFGSATEYTTYYSDVFNLTPDHPTVDYASPDRHDLIFMTTGKIGNTNTTVNRGVELDFDLGEIKLLKTTLYLNGAWSETKTWSTDMNAESVRAALLPTSYSAYGLTPFKIVYPDGEDFSRYRRFVTTLRAVTHIPALHMVASTTAQAIWHNSNYSYIAAKDPIAWITPDLERHTITPSMTEIGFDGGSVSLADLNVRPTDNEPSKSPVTWNLQARLTKELGKVGGLSFYVNNALFYEPFLKGNNTTTLTQRNTGTFSFGAELSLSL